MIELLSLGSKENSQVDMQSLQVSAKASEQLTSSNHHQTMWVLGGAFLAILTFFIIVRVLSNWIRKR